MIFPQENEPATSHAFGDPRPTALYAASAAQSTANLWTSINGFAVARRYSTLEEEYTALTEKAGVVDFGALCRYSARGMDASALLARLASAPAADLGVGESARGLILDNDGHVVDICEIARIAGDLFLLTTGAPCDRRLQVAARGLKAEVENITGVVAALAILGPAARDAAAAAGFELSNENVASQGRVRGVETSLRAIDMGATSGVEIIYPAEEALVLWERVRRAARLPPVGLDVCETLRIEGGVPRLGLDYGGADAAPPAFRRRPEELGLPHLAPTSRAWFNGRRALLDAEKPERRLITLAADVDALQAGGAVFAKSANVGRVTSASFSPRFRAAICFADIADAAAAKALELSPAPGGAPVSARVLATPESGLADAYHARERAATESRARFV